MTSILLSCVKASSDDPPPLPDEATLDRWLDDLPPDLASRNAHLLAALHTVACRGWTGWVDRLLPRANDPTETVRGLGVLHQACMGASRVGARATLDRLLQDPAIARTVNQPGGASPNDLYVPLTWAASMGQADVSVCLLEPGVPKPEPALELQDHVCVGLDRLLDAGANPLLADRHGLTALHHAFAVRAWTVARHLARRTRPVAAVRMIEWFQAHVSSGWLVLQRETEIQAILHEAQQAMERKVLNHVLDDAPLASHRERVRL